MRTLAGSTITATELGVLAPLLAKVAGLENKGRHGSLWGVNRPRSFAGALITLAVTTRTPVSVTSYTGTVDLLGPGTDLVTSGLTQLAAGTCVRGYCLSVCHVLKHAVRI